MKWFNHTRAIVFLSLGCVGLLCWLTGCQIGPSKAADARALSVAESLGRLRVDDLVSVVFSGTPTPPEKFEGRIKEDGFISLPLVGNVKGAGKTTGELEKEIRGLYVPRFFVNLSVNVNSENRFFFVDGEVRSPNRYVHSGKLSVLQAVASAGGFTDFANRRKVQIIRVNGEMSRVNCVKAKSNPELDSPIFPGDKIIVPRRFTGN